MLSSIIKKWFDICQLITDKLLKALHGLCKLLVCLVLAFIPVLIIWAITGKVSDSLEFRDNDANRGAAAIVNDPIDQNINKEDIDYLSQNWDARDSLWFYRATQGSNLLPYAFFLHLEQPGETSLLRDDEYMNSFRYLPQDPTLSNPDGLAVGMSKDTYQGKEYIGLTCAACHTSQINYVADGKAKAIRIDGGPSAANLEAFLMSMADALEQTQSNPDKLKRFIGSVKGEKGYSKDEDVKRDLAYYTMRIRNYVDMNAPVNDQGTKTHYGFSRLDAFGRIYNRVMQYVADASNVQIALKASLPKRVWQQAEPEINAIFADEDQTNLLVRSMVVAENYRASVSENEWQAGIDRLRNRLFNPANAPASYPYLWDTAQHDFVQWTGLVANAGIGALGRNVGQVIGVFGTLDWQRKEEFSLLSLLGKRDESKTQLDFKSSINKRNLARVEQHLRKLQSPAWPNQFPALDQEKLDAGREIFQQRCLSCHANIDPRDPARRIIVSMSSVENVGTDATLANNAVNYDGYSGLLKGKYVETSVGDVLIEERQATALMVRSSTRGVVTRPDADVGFIRGWAEWAWDILETLGNNEIKPTIRRGDYTPPTTAKPFNHVRSYKARALNGIWATAPYLHNGSIPNLYELLLPKRQEGDPELDEQGNKIEYRSDAFYVGSREFDFDKVGFKSGSHERAFRFDTNLPGNGNAGHEYAAGRTAVASGRKFAPLTKTQRYELLEYLKSL